MLTDREPVTGVVVLTRVANQHEDLPGIVHLVGDDFGHHFAVCLRALRIYAHGPHSASSGDAPHTGPIQP